MKCSKAKRDVKIAEIARLDSYLLTQTDRERLWTGEKFDRERKEKLSLIEEVERLHALVREKESALNAPAGPPDVGTQNTYGSNSLPHSEPCGRSQGPDPTKSMATTQSDFDKGTPSQIEEREGEIRTQTGKQEADHPEVKESQNINPKSPGYSVLIERQRAELGRNEQHDIDNSPERRTLRKYDRHDADDRDGSLGRLLPRKHDRRGIYGRDYSPEKHSSRKHDQPVPDSSVSSPERRTLRKCDRHGADDRDSSLGKRTSRKHDRRGTYSRDHSPGRRTSRQHDQSDADSSDSSPERRTSRKRDQHNTGTRDSSPEKRTTLKNSQRKTTRTTDDKHRNPDNHVAQDKHKHSTSPSSHHTRSRRREGQGQKHSPHRHSSRRSRTPTHRHGSHDPHKRNKGHKPRDRYESSDRGRSRHRHGKHDSSDSEGRDSSSDNSSESDASDDDQLSEYSFSRRDWDTKLPLVLMAMRATPNRATGRTPFEIMTGRLMTLPVHLLYVPAEDETPTAMTPTEYLSGLNSHLQSTFAMVRDQLQEEAQGSKAYYDRKASHTEYQLGDQVLYLNYEKRKQKCRKFLPSWTGPHEIADKMSPVIYQLKITKTGREQQYKWVHINQIKPYPVLVEQEQE
uniref:Protein starmaker-like n=1 Tax=Petromyzon marinus TaxID=7757 RepID=A0AAJ7SJ39_PETMA|nr:protein starmaker-like [Petromyzon marinus]